MALLITLFKVISSIENIYYNRFLKVGEIIQSEDLQNERVYHTKELVSSVLFVTRTYSLLMASLRASFRDLYFSV